MFYYAIWTSKMDGKSYRSQSFVSFHTMQAWIDSNLSVKLHTEINWFSTSEEF